ncbi:hypothetical protein [Pelotomaculum sp. PtaB.Bin117]|uniref:hypothetical protein n=1 Tax=Pelotomaculum sp. PtaB.Bin117 TaxID=1811694 RepID=UPI00257B90F1|nr:hypothetical protein [Pelotomaculum sp. PtaB.Bin117]
MEHARVSLFGKGQQAKAALPLALGNTGARLHVKGGHGHFATIIPYKLVTFWLSFISQFHENL